MRWTERTKLSTIPEHGLVPLRLSSLRNLGTSVADNAFKTDYIPQWCLHRNEPLMHQRRSPTRRQRPSCRVFLVTGVISEVLITHRQWSFRDQLMEPRPPLATRRLWWKGRRILIFERGQKLSAKLIGHWLLVRAAACSVQSTEREDTTSGLYVCSDGIIQQVDTQGWRPG